MWKLKMNLNLAGTSFTDELHTDLGAGTFTLNHDWFINDVGETLVIRTASGGGGVLLIEDTDYMISNQDMVLSDADHVNQNVFSTIQIINAAYQTGNLYFSGKYVADSIDSADINRQVVAVSTSQTLAPTYLPIYLCTSGAAGIRLTLPDATISPSMILEFNKVDTGAGAVTLVPYSGQNINGMSYIFLTEQYQKVVLVSDGTNWIIQSGVLYWISGGRNTNDWTNRELGFSQVTYDNKSAGSILIGDLVTESVSGITGIIIANSGTVLTLVKTTGLGYFTNDRTLTHSQSGVTCQVNNAGTDKNQDTNCLHNTGLNGSRFEVELWVSANAIFSWTNATRIGRFYASNAAYFGNAEVINIDSNNVKIQTGSDAVILLAENGGVTVLDNEDYSYNVVLKMVI